MDNQLTLRETQQLFSCLIEISRLYPINLIITGPNHDQGSHIIRSVINDSLKALPNAIFVDNLGGPRYHTLLSLSSMCTVIVIGNSSSIVKEAPFYGAHGLNVGTRQLGREKAETQHDVIAIHSEIKNKLIPLLSTKCTKKDNPYYRPSSSLRAYEFLINNLRSRSKSELLFKKWYNSDS